MPMPAVAEVAAIGAVADFTEAATAAARSPFEVLGAALWLCAAGATAMPPTAAATVPQQWVPQRWVPQRRGATTTAAGAGGGAAAPATTLCPTPHWRKIRGAGAGGGRAPAP